MRIILRIIATLFAILLTAFYVYAQNPEPRKSNPMIAPQFITVAAETSWEHYRWSRHPATQNSEEMDTVNHWKELNAYAQAIIRAGNSLSFDPSVAGKRVTIYNSDISGKLDFVWDDGNLSIVMARLDSLGLGVDYLYPLTTSIFVRGSIVPDINDLYDLGSREPGILLGGPHQFRNIYIAETTYTAKFFMPTGANNGYVVTSNADGLGTWQNVFSLVGDTAGTLHRSDSTWLFTEYDFVTRQFRWSVTGETTKTDSLRFIPGSHVTLIQSGNTVTIASADSIGKANTANFTTDPYQHTYVFPWAMIGPDSERVAIWEAPANQNFTIDSMHVEGSGTFTGVTFNAKKLHSGSFSDMLSSNYTVTTTVAKPSGIQNNTFVGTDCIYVMIRGLSTGQLDGCRVTFFFRRTS